MEATAAAPVIIAGRPRKPSDLNAGELVGLMIRAQHGERDAARYLEAALTETLSTDVTGLLPPQYETTVLGGKEVPRTLYGVFGGRPLPGVGLAINKPKWTTPPNGAWAANVDADATSTKVVVGSQAASILRWDWAGAISWVVVERSDPGIVDEIYAEAVQDFYNDVEIKIKDQMVAAAGTADASDTLGEGVAAFHLKSQRQHPGRRPHGPGRFREARGRQPAQLERRFRDAVRDRDALDDLGGASGSRVRRSSRRLAVPGDPAGYRRPHDGAGPVDR